MIYHIINADDWTQAQTDGSYAPLSLNNEGFIHFSKLEQVLATVQRFYADVPDLILLAVDEKKLAHQLIYERGVDVAEDFPHLYGVLNLDAVVGAYGFSADKSSLPADLPTNDYSGF